MVRWLALLLLLPAVRTDAGEGPVILALPLPSRAPDTAELATKTVELAERLARIWHGRMWRPPTSAGLRTSESSDIEARLERAEALSFTSDVDRAAALYDAALDDGARALHRVARPDLFVTAHVRRAAIGLARGEREHVRDLLSRIVRYDPNFDLLPNEGSPQMRAALKEIAGSSASRPRDNGASLLATELQGSCSAADVLLAARRLPNRQIEFSRFDHCQLIARSSGDPSSVIAILSQPIPFGAQTKTERSPARRTKLAAGITLLAVGLALGIAGTYFAVEAASDRANYNNGCSPSLPCPGEELRRRLDRYNQDTTIGTTVWAIGGTSLIGGAILTALGAPSRSHAHRTIEVRK